MSIERDYLRELTKQLRETWLQMSRGIEIEEQIKLREVALEEARMKAERAFPDDAENVEQIVNCVREATMREVLM